jgi:hypothetical protein
MRPHLLLLLAAPAACVGGPTDNDDGPPPVANTCSEDDDCDAGLICDNTDTCVVGDRDNEPASATPMLFNEERDGVIEPPGDADYFSFETLEDGVWVVITTVHDRDASDLDTVVHLYGADGRERAWADNYDLYSVVSTDSNLIAWLPRAGTWYVMVEDTSTFYGADEPRGDEDFAYTLTLGEFTVTTDEGGDVPVVELENGSSVSRRAVLIGEPGDVDTLEVQAPYDGRLLQVTAGTGVVDSDLTARVSLFRDDVLVMRQDDLRSGTYGMLPQSVEGSYELQIDDADGGGSDDAWTVLYFRTYDEDASVTFWGDTRYEDEAEPNDDVTAALEVDTTSESTSSGLDYDGAYVEGRIDAPDDQDWFAIDLDQDRQLTVRCYADQVGSIADLAFDLYDPDGALVSTTTDYDDWTAPQLYNEPIEADGTWTLRVYAEQPEFGPAAWYRCQLFDTDWDVAEP